MSPKPLAARLELQVELRLADLEAVIDIEDGRRSSRAPRPRAQRQLRGERSGCARAGRDLGAGRRTVVVVERQAVHAGEVADPLTPAPRELGRPELAVDVRNEVGRDDRHVTAGHGDAAARTERAGVGTSDPCLIPSKTVSSVEPSRPRAHSPLRHEFGADLFGGSGHQLHHLASVRHRRAEGKLDHPVGELALDLGKKLNFRCLAGDHADSHDEPREEDGHGQVAVSHQPPGQRRHARGNDPLDPLGEARAGASPAVLNGLSERLRPFLPLSFVLPTCRRLRGQDEHGLHQREHRTGMTISGMLRKNLPVMPGTSARGMNAMIVVRTAKVTASGLPGFRRSRLPAGCRCGGGRRSPRPPRTASSTAMPSTRMKANRRSC